MLIFEYSSIICKKCNPGNHIVTGASLLIGVNFSVGPMSPDLSYLTRCPLSVLRSNFGRLGLPEHLTTFIIVCCGISPNSQHMASNLSRAEASLFEPSSRIWATLRLFMAVSLPILLISSFCLIATYKASLISSSNDAYIVSKVVYWRYTFCCIPV